MIYLKLGKQRQQQNDISIRNKFTKIQVQCYIISCKSGI